MARVVMDALSHQAIRMLGSEDVAYGNAPDRVGRWRGLRLTGLAAMLAGQGHELAIAGLDEATLSSATVLVIASRSQACPFTAVELKTIGGFVERGGGLLVMGNHRGFIAPQQALADALQLPFAYNDVSIVNFPAIATSGHSLAEGVARIVVRNTASLRAGEGADRIAWFAGDPTHTFALACMKGQGRVVAIGDSGFIASSDDTGRDLFAEAGNRRLISNVIDWLAHG